VVARTDAGTRAGRARRQCRHRGVGFGSARRVRPRDHRRTPTRVRGRRDGASRLAPARGRDGDARAPDGLAGRRRRREPLHFRGAHVGLYARRVRTHASGRDAPAARSAKH
jgi:hypothetical protein